MHGCVQDEDVGVEAELEDMPEDGGAAAPVLQARACLEQEGESEVVRTGGGEEEGAVEREAARDEAAVRAEGKGAECGVVGGGGVRRGG